MPLSVTASSEIDILARGKTRVTTAEIGVRLSTEDAIGKFLNKR